MRKLPSIYFTLKLGEYYLINWYSNPLTLVKFIKVTKKGYNFLNPVTNKCMLINKHLYRNKNGSFPFYHDHFYVHTIQGII